jgi:transcriptional regulator with XRE-family HTH domain
MRYRTLINDAIENGTKLRELARKLNLPPSSIHNYITMGTEPRFDALQKMSTFFGEPISSLLSEDDDLTAQILEIVRRLSPDEKQTLLDSLKDRK